MASIQKFEDLICWQKSRELTKEILKNFPTFTAAPTARNFN